ncbi:MAG: hypothetical protein QM723_26875 [Myxococcaceae bacterium]
MIALVLLACGKPTPEEECKKFVSATCSKLFDCDKAAAMTLFSSESDCEVKQQMQADCKNAMASCTYDDSAVNACVDDVKRESCSAAGTGQLPPSCAPAKICPGAVVCDSSDVSSGSSGCTYTLGGDNGPCSDGHTYGAHCASATSCDCQRDGAATGTSFNTSSDLCQQTGTQQKASLKTGCGFTF